MKKQYLLFLLLVPTTIFSHPGFEAVFMMAPDTWPKLRTYECEGKICFEYEPFEVTLVYTNKMQKKFTILPHYEKKLFTNIQTVEAPEGAKCIDSIIIKRHKRTKEKNKVILEIDKEVIFETKVKDCEETLFKISFSPSGHINVHGV